MLTVSLHKPEFLSFSHYGFRDLHKFSRIPSSWTIAMSNYSGSSETRKKEELSIQVPATSISSSETQRLAGSDLRFDRLQVPEKELMHDRKFEFGQFVAREAVIDEEYWVCHPFLSHPCSNSTWVIMCLSFPFLFIFIHLARSIFYLFN
ncbi:hypothetical protein H0E87_012626 [Populus deltoides]|uniref:Uncharacterized protein n=1 Tax=Populus deltoides TaxID=3696 RepID=A0A8T2YJY5_POPDE|nr:hypothetical protein H0E87_012626 [Populus deltoides]